MIFIIINKSLFLGVGIKYNSSSLPPSTHTLKGNYSRSLWSLLGQIFFNVGRDTHSSSLKHRNLKFIHMCLCRITLPLPLVNIRMLHGWIRYFTSNLSYTVPSC